MTKALVLDPFSGASGDMLLAALVDLGAPFDVVREAILDIPAFREVRAEAKVVQRGVFQAVRIEVDCPESAEHRSVADIRRIVEASPFAPVVKQRIMKNFDALAGAESKVHGCQREEVHFHEVGALDAMFDIFGAHLALELLGNPVGYTRPLTLGNGKTVCRHGEIPIPSPATLELLRGFPIKLTDRAEELVTPTGAAIIASRFTPLPSDAMIIPDRVGYGAGSREAQGLPNVLRAVLGTVEPRPSRVSIATCTIDDMNPQVYGYLMERLFASGALEVYYNPVMMKKNRPGVEITVITEEKDMSRTVDFLMTETTTLGVRAHSEERIELRRHRDAVETPFGPVAIKVAERPGGFETMSPEYESCKMIAEKAGVPLIDVYEAARRSWNEKHGRA
jgi:uncharacterized protein (TIGR00299 family) protein